MRIIGCDLHARQQTLAMLDTVSGEVVNRTLMHEGSAVREFYSQLPRPALLGIEAIGKNLLQRPTSLEMVRIVTVRLIRLPASLLGREFA